MTTSRMSCRSRNQSVGSLSTITAANGFSTVPGSPGAKSVAGSAGPPAIHVRVIVMAWVGAGIRVKVRVSCRGQGQRRCWFHPASELLPNATTVLTGNMDVASRKHLYKRQNTPCERHHSLSQRGSAAPEMVATEKGAACGWAASSSSVVVTCRKPYSAATCAGRMLARSGTRTP